MSAPDAAAGGRPAGQARGRRYSSFVVRCWWLESGDRIEIEHVQTGQRTRLAALDAVGRWIGAQASRTVQDDGGAGLAASRSGADAPGRTREGNAAPPPGLAPKEEANGS
jgi:hypothetical protein